MNRKNTLALICSLVLILVFANFVSAFNSGWLPLRDKNNYVVCGEDYSACTNSNLGVDWFKGVENNKPYDLIAGEISSVDRRDVLLHHNAGVGQVVSVPEWGSYYVMLKSWYAYTSNSAGTKEFLKVGVTKDWNDRNVFQNVVDLGSGNKRCVLRNKIYIGNSKTKLWIQGTHESVNPYQYKIQSCISQYEVDSGLVYCDTGLPAVANCNAQCTPNIVNSSWSSWTNLNCVSTTQRNQSRYLTEYDANDCGTFSNRTYYQFRLVNDASCNTCVPVDGGWSATSYGDWSSCVNNQRTRTLTQTCNNPTPNSCGQDCVTTSGWTRNGNTQTRIESESCGACVPFTTTDCFTGNLGICASGTRTCSILFQWGSCEQNNQPVGEICDNGLDDDCDGFIDGADSDCDIDECNDGAIDTRSCNNGQLGECARTGSQTRVCSGGSWGSWGSCSVGYVAPGTESCNNLDDDCDGVADENLLRNSFANNYCLGQSPLLWIFGNFSQEYCSGGSWINLNYFSVPGDACPVETNPVDVYCEDEDTLVYNNSMPTCSAGVCGFEYNLVEENCEYGCNDSSSVAVCNPPTDWPTCSVDYLATQGGVNVFNISDYYFNQIGNYLVFGSASANSNEFLLQLVSYNYTNHASWISANSQLGWELWSSDLISFSNGNYSVCCNAVSQRCEGGNNCEVRESDVVCESFCIDSQNPSVNINAVVNMTNWTSSVFNWSWVVSDVGCAGIDYVNVSVADLNGTTLGDYENYLFDYLEVFNLVANHSYRLDIFAVDNAGNIGNSFAVLTLAGNITNENPTNCTDDDEDGYSIEGGSCGQIDCDDEDSSVNPGEDEVCDDEIDNDCDGDIDDEDSDCDDDDDDDDDEGCSTCGKNYFNGVSRSWNLTNDSILFLGGENLNSEGIDFDWNWLWFVIALIVLILLIILLVRLLN